MKRKTFGFMTFLLVMLMAVTGCTSTGGTDADLVASEADVVATDSGMTAITGDSAEEVIDGLFNVEDLNIASYRIRGEGPDGAYFDWVEADSPMIALADIRRGEWTLYAQGLNKDGEVVVQGMLETFLSEDSPVDNLVFDEAYGQGNVRCAIAWNPHQVQHPDIDVYVQRVGGQFVAHDDSEIAYGNGTAIWSTRGLDSGSYIVRFILKDRQTVVSGAAAALRVIDDKTSVGNVRMTIGDLSQVYGITLDNIPADVLQGQLVFDGAKDAVFESETPDLIYDWYIDGNYVGAGADSDQIDLSGLAKGYHRIDVIARTSTYGSINGDSIHIYTDGELVNEIDEEEVNKVIEMFLPTAENEEMLRSQVSEEIGAEVEAEAETVQTTADEEAEAVAPVEETVEEAAETAAVETEAENVVEEADAVLSFESVELPAEGIAEDEVLSIAI